jgi:putative transposase
MVAELMATHDLSQRRACGLIGITRRALAYKAGADRDDELRQRLRTLAEEKRRWGCPLLYQSLRREGFKVNHKRVERLYREAGLSLRRRRRRKRLSHLRVVLDGPHAANQVWAVDFVHDSLADGRRLRVLTVIDQWSRESPALEVEVSLTGEHVTKGLERLRNTRGVPTIIQSDNGAEFTGRKMDQWADEHGVRLHFIQPGKPLQNAFIESFNSRLRQQCLNQHVFISLDDARRKIERWRIEYNCARPHSSLGYLTPAAFAASADQTRSAAAARTALPANRWLAAALQSAPSADPKPDSFRPPSEIVKGGRKTGK